VALVRTDVSEEPGSSFIRVTRIVELGTTQAATSSIRRLLVAACVVPSSPIFVTLMKEEPGSSETSVLTRAARRNNPEDTILQLWVSVSVLLLQNCTGIILSSPLLPSSLYLTFFSLFPEWYEEFSWGGLGWSGDGVER
jgi:hypothetical protein